MLIFEIGDVDFKSLDHDDNENQNIYIGFGRKNSISSAFEYDIVNFIFEININKMLIKISTIIVFNSVVMFICRDMEFIIKLFLLKNCILVMQTNKELILENSN